MSISAGLGLELIRASQLFRRIGELPLDIAWVLFHLVKIEALKNVKGTAGTLHIIDSTKITIDYLDFDPLLDKQKNSIGNMWNGLLLTIRSFSRLNPKSICFIQGIMVYYEMNWAAYIWLAQNCGVS